MSDVPSQVRDVIIIGSGPAGLTAAVYTARANLAPLLIEGEPSSTSDQPGGQLMLTTEVENYPGFAEGIMGPDLMQEMRDQALRFGTEIITEKVTKVDFSERPHKVWVRDTLYLANAVIVSTGAQSLMLGLEAEERLIGHGLSTCATCDGFFFRGHEIAVVGGGDSAIEEATFLTKFADKVTIVHRRDELRASKIMQDRAFANPKIDFLWNSQVTEIMGEQSVTGIGVVNTVTGEPSTLDVTGLFVAIGHRPNTDLFVGQLDMEPDSGYLITAHDSSFTNVDGVFACGDVQDHTYRQAITAAGLGLYGGDRRGALARGEQFTTQRDSAITLRRIEPEYRPRCGGCTVAARLAGHPHGKCSSESDAPNSKGLPDGTRNRESVHQHLRRDRRRLDQAGRRRLLGRVVRAVQEDRTDPRGDRRRARRRRDDRQAERRRQP